jgi:hypothetical protein
MTRKRVRRKPEDQPLEPPVQEEAEGLEEELPRYPIQQSAAFAGSTLALGSLVDLLAHLGPTGLFLSGLASYVAWRHGPELVAYLRGKRPADTLAFAPSFGADEDAAEDGAQRGGRGLLERLFVAPEDEEDEEEDDQDEEREGEETEEEQNGVRLPTAPPFSEMCHLIARNRLVLCWTVQGPLYGTIKDLLSMVIVGKPGRGKTTALIYYVAILLKAGAEVHVWDPHGSLSELAGSFERLHYTDDLADLPESIAALNRELEVRRVLYKQVKERIEEIKPPLLLLVDELPVIAQYSRKNKEASDLIERFVLEARKWYCFFIGAGQSTDADILPTRVCDNLASRVVFYSSNRRATMAGLDIETAHRLLPALKPDEVKGRMIFDCSRVSEPVVGAIPWTRVKDLPAFLGPALMPRPKEQTAGLPLAAPPSVPRTQEAAPARTRDLTVEQLLSLVERLPEVDPADSRYGQQAEPVQPARNAQASVPSRPAVAEPVQMKCVPTQRFTAGLSPELQTAYEAWQEGMSLRDFGRSLGVSKDTAGKLLQRLKDKKAVDPTGHKLLG